MHFPLLTKCGAEGLILAYRGPRYASVVAAFIFDVMAFIQIAQPMQNAQRDHFIVPKDYYRLLRPAMEVRKDIALNS